MLHSSFFDVMAMLKDNGCEAMTLTTNGFFLTRKHIDFFKSLNLHKFTLSISLDSLVAKEHNSFRGNKGAFDGAIRSIEMLKDDIPEWFYPSLRVTLRPEQISVMEDIAEFAYSNSLKRVSFSGIHPVGRAYNKPEYWMKPQEKKKFLEKLYIALLCRLWKFPSVAKEEWRAVPG